MRDQRRLADYSLRALLLAGGAVSCSFLYDLDQVQCEIKDDCAGFDPGADCIDGICVQPADPTSTSSGGAGGTTSNTSSGGTTSNTSSGGNGGSTTATSTTGSAGAAGAPGCLENQECIDENNGNPAICDDGDCVNLDHPECPVVLGQGTNMENIRDKNPIVFGAYSFIDPVVPENSAPTRNYALAIDEINDETGGGLLVNSERRPFVGIVCDAYGDLDASMDHLLNQVEVPAVISALYSGQLLDTFENHGKLHGTFFLSPLETDSTLTNPDLDPDGLMWHLLTDATTLAQAYKPLMERTEVLIREQRGLTTEPIKVVMVVAGTPFLEDIADVATSTLEFNGVTAAQNILDGNLVRINIDSGLEGSVSGLLTKAVEIRDHKPHVILAFASYEFMNPDMIGTIENSWGIAFTPPDPAAPPPPFYLLSPYLYGVGDTLARAEELDDLEGQTYPAFIPLRQRMLGVNFAAADDLTLYGQYYSRLTAANPGIMGLGGTENFYDAAYFLMYSITGSGFPTTLTGTHVRDGMNRLLGGLTGSLQANVHPNDVANVTGTLRGSAESKVRLTGTLGPPDFNTTSGAKRGLPSIYCIDQGATNMEFQPDVLTYDPTTEALEGSVPPCSVEGFTLE